MQQLGFSFKASGRGGARVGAGRKRLPAGSRRTPHRARPKHRGAHIASLNRTPDWCDLDAEIVGPLESQYQRFIVNYRER